MLVCARLVLCMACDCSRVLRVLFLVGCFAALVAVCPLRLFVCRLWLAVLRVACLWRLGLFDCYCVSCVS